MKLRIRDNSIRLRLTQAEGDGLDYILESSPVTERPSARFTDGALTVMLPEAEVM